MNATCWTKSGKPRTLRFRLLLVKLLALNHRLGQLQGMRLSTTIQLLLHMDHFVWEKCRSSNYYVMLVCLKSWWSCALVCSKDAVACRHLQSPPTAHESPACKRKRMQSPQSSPNRSCGSSCWNRRGSCERIPSIPPSLPILSAEEISAKALH